MKLLSVLSWGDLFSTLTGYRDLKRERRKPSYALTLNGVFDLKVTAIDDSFGKAMHITISPYGEDPPDRLDG